jgi:hypothetical protein
MTRPGTEALGLVPGLALATSVGAPVAVVAAALRVVGPALDATARGITLRGFAVAPG